MAKKLLRKLKLAIDGGKASAAPPVGPALGQAKVNIGEFVSRFNTVTKDRLGELVPVNVLIYDDKTFELDLRQPPAAYLIKKAAKIEKGSGKNNTVKVGTITKSQLKEIAEKKIKDLNANTIEAAMEIIRGSARAMGVEVRP